MKVIAFIHAKKHSKRLPNKNMRRLGDRPLVAHAITTAVKSNLFDEVVIDSDSEKIIETGYIYGATKHLKRDEHQATNNFTGDDLAYWQASNFPDSDICVQLVPTSPFITSETIQKVFEILINKYFNSVVGIREERYYIFGERKKRLLNSFELTPVNIETTGLYASRTEAILESKRRTNYPARGLYLSKIEAIDINTLEDFEFAEIVWRGMMLT